MNLVEKLRLDENLLWKHFFPKKQNKKIASLYKHTWDRAHQAVMAGAESSSLGAPFFRGSWDGFSVTETDQTILTLAMLSMRDRDEFIRHICVVSK